MFKILVTCPPMIRQIHHYDSKFKSLGLDYHCPKFTQTMTEDELIQILPSYDGWIIGDDPATRKVFEAGKNGKLRAAVKWGVGVDNVDFVACKDLDIPITNVPGVFREEVSDVAIGYLLCLTRKLHVIDNEVKHGNWVKPCGNSLTGKKVCLVGFGDIGRCTARKLLAFNLNVYVSDPGFSVIDNKIVCNYNPDIVVDEYLQSVHLGTLDDSISNADYIVTTCNLNKFTHHLINKNNIIMANKGVKIINVARGPIVKEEDVLELLENGHIDSVGFDVFEHEPLLNDNKLRNYSGNIFGSHNGSNTIEAVHKVSHFAINKIYEYLH
jgi:D-3-phosphoglycerate dehydrogenase